MTLGVEKGILDTEAGERRKRRAQCIAMFKRLCMIGSVEIQDLHGTKHGTSDVGSGSG